MSTNIKTSATHQFSDDIKLIEQSINNEDNLEKIIDQQLQKTYISGSAVLQKLQDGIYLFTVKKHDTITALRLKKLSDRAQYGILPIHHNNEAFYKISLNNLKSQCHGLSPSSWLTWRSDQGSPLTCHLYFYLHVTQLFSQELKRTPFYVREILSNRTIMLTDGEYNYPLAITELACLAIWCGEHLTQ